MFKRIFSFGCSYTRYKWPTWSDIIALDLELPYQNWGIGGTGNFAIQSRLVECDLKNNLTDSDLVMVLWSGWNREDRFHLDQDGWLRGGFIFNNPNYDMKYLEKYWRLENDIVRNITVLHSTRKAYKGIIKFEGQLTSPYFGDEYFGGRVNPIDVEINDWALKILKNVENHFNHIPTFPKVIPSTWNALWNDIHPSIKDHLDFVTNSIYPRLNLHVKQSTIDTVDNLTEEIIKFLKSNKLETTHTFYDKIHSISRSYGLLGNYPESNNWT